MLCPVSIQDIMSDGYGHNGKTKDVKIYRDILLWYASKFFSVRSFDSRGLRLDSMEVVLNTLNKSMIFRFTEIGKWLISNHRPFIDEYRSSNYPKSWRLHTKRNYIKARLDDLIELGLLRIIKYEDSSKNKTKTPIYQFSKLGSIISWILEVTLGSQNNDFASIIIQATVIQVLADRYTSFDAFLIMFLERCYQMNLVKKFLNSFGFFISYLFIEEDKKILREFFISLKGSDEELYKVFIDTLYTLMKKVEDCFCCKLNLM